MFQITILFLYAAAAGAFVMSRLPAHVNRSKPLILGGFLVTAIAMHLHLRTLLETVVPEGSLSLTLPGAVSLIALQLALIALVAALDATLRGLTAALLFIAAVLSLATGNTEAAAAGSELTWQIQMHVLLSMFAYGLLTAGAIVAVYALVQDRRLRAAKMTALNHLFAPLDTTENLLSGISVVGFAVLALSVVSGIMFVENLFAQHLVHKTTLSLLALLVFGVLITGRLVAGWRGKRAVYLYLGGFFILCLAYFGSRFILEEVLNRSWS